MYRGMTETPLKFTEREEKLIEYLRSDQDQGQVHSINAAWSPLRYAVDLDSEIERLKQAEDQDLSELIKDLRKKSGGLKVLSQIIGNGG